MDTLGLVLAIAIFIACGSIIRLLSNILHSRIRQPNIRTATPGEVPLPLQHGFTDYATQALPEGFQFSHYERQQTTEHAVNLPVWAAIYFHEQEQSYIEFTAHDAPTELRPFKTACVTLYAYNRIMTCDPSSNFIMNKSGEFQFFKTRHDNLKAQWAQHLEHSKRYEKSDAPIEGRITLSMVEYSRRSRTDIGTYTNVASEKYLLKNTTDGYKLTWKSIQTLFLSNKQPTINIDVADLDINNDVALSNENLTQIEVQAYYRKRQLETNTHITLAFKTFAFILSAVTCGIFMGYVFSWKLAFYLLPVLLFHELGHLVAMMAFKYERKFMLFMPLGAFVTGENDSAPTWQRMVVFLAGPVPGILLALALIFWLPSINESLGMLILVLLAINLSNLLPVMPLDGGQLVHLAVSNRFPSVQFALHVLSFLGTLGFALLLWNPFFIVFSVWLGLSLKQSYSNIQLFKIANTSRKGAESQQQLIEHLFSALRYTKSNFNDRYDQVRNILSYNQRGCSTVLSSFAMLTYALALVVPLALVYSNVNEVLERYNGASNYNNSASGYDIESRLTNRDEYLAKRLEYSTTLEERLETMLSAAYYPDNGDSSSTLAYLKNALKISEDRVDLSYYQPDIYTSMFFHFNELDNSEGADQILLTMQARGETEPTFIESVANIYTRLSHSNELSDEVKLGLLKKAFTIHSSLNDEYSEVAAAIDLARKCHEIGDEQMAYSLLNNYTSITLVDKATSAMLFESLAELHTKDANFAAAKANILKAKNLSVNHHNASLSNQMGWLNLFDGGTQLAQIHFDQERNVRQSEARSWEDGLSYFEIIAFKLLSIDPDLWSPRSDIPYLVMAYLNNDRELANTLYTAMQARWSKQQTDSRIPISVAEYFENTSWSEEVASSSYSRRNGLTLNAIQYAEQTYE